MHWKCARFEPKSGDMLRKRVGETGRPGIPSLKLLLTTLDTHGVDYLLIGSCALCATGYQRSTVDFDGVHRARSALVIRRGNAVGIVAFLLFLLLFCASCEMPGGTALAVATSPQTLYILVGIQLVTDVPMPASVSRPYIYSSSVYASRLRFGQRLSLAKLTRQGRFEVVHLL